jgi:hypothetical protein
MEARKQITCMTMKCALGLSLLLGSSTLLFSAGHDWPQWRGPNRDGSSRESGLLKEWPAGGPPLLWTARKVGPGYSSVSVANGKIFTAGDEGTNSSFVHAFDLNGKLLWSSKLGRPGERGGFAGPRSTPTVDGAMVYTLGQFGDLVCHQVADGKEVWRKNLAKDFGGKVGGWGYSESVIVDGNNVVCTPGGSNTMLALDKRTGDTVWRTADWKDSADYVSATIATIGGVKQYVQMTPRSVAGVSPAGKLLWRAERRGSTAIIPTPVVKDDLVYVTSGYGVGCNGFKITKSGDTFSAEQIYTNKVMVNHHGGVILLGDHVYGYSDGKGWTCQNVKTGESVWASNKLGKGAIAYADGRFYLRKEDGKGTVVLIEATPEAYKEVGRFDQPERSTKNSWAHPVISNGKLYLRDQDTLLCYDVTQK